MKKIKIIGALFAIVISSISYLKFNNSKLINNVNDNKILYFSIWIHNMTSNVSGGDPSHFGTWFYLDISINGVFYNDTNFKGITTENDSNAGGASGSAGRRGDKDVFVTGLNTSVLILDYFKINVSKASNPVLEFTFGTFYWAVGFFFHTQLVSVQNFQLSFSNKASLSLDAIGYSGRNGGGWCVVQY